MQRPIVGYAGLTHLGTCSAIGAATKGFSVVGLADDIGLVQRFRNGQLPVLEPGLDAALAAHSGNLSFSASCDDLATCDIVYVAVDVPTADDGTSDLSAIEAMIARISHC